MISFPPLQWGRYKKIIPYFLKKAKKKYLWDGIPAHTDFFLEFCVQGFDNAPVIAYNIEK